MQFTSHVGELANIPIRQLAEFLGVELSVKHTLEPLAGPASRSPQVRF